MVTPRIEYRSNPRYHADDIPVYFGSSQDSRLLYDPANDEWTLQTKNASGTQVDRIRVESNTDTPVAYFDVRGGMMIGLAASAPAPDQSAVHIWEASAGAVEADSESVLVLESNDRAILSLLAPDTQAVGIYAGSPTGGALRGQLLYGGPTHAQYGDKWVFFHAGANTLRWASNNMEFRQAQTLSTITGDLTLNPAGYAVLNSSKGTTGDPTGAEGMIYINTTDNVVRMYADGAWRTLASW